MLHAFLKTNSGELIDRCRAKVAMRPAPRPTPREMEHGIPLFLAQLIEALRVEPMSGDSQPADMVATAARHGHELLDQGYAVDQVVHDYGDLCQAVTELAIEQNLPISAADFRTLNLCLDNAIANAVTEFARERDTLIAERDIRATSERLGSLAHELRNFLNTAFLSFAAIKGGSVAANGATARVLDRSLQGLRDLIDRTLADVRLSAGMPPRMEVVALDRFIADVQVAAGLGARARNCGFNVSPVQRDLLVRVDGPLLYSAVSNLLDNAFKFTRAHSQVALRAYAQHDRVLIEVEDQCGGLPEGMPQALFAPFHQCSEDRSGAGLGLSISRRAVEAVGGTLGLRDMPGLGCVFTIDLPRHAASPQPR